MVKKREMKGQPGKKVGCPDIQMAFFIQMDEILEA